MSERRVAYAAGLALLACLGPAASRAADARDPAADPNTPLVHMPDGVQASPSGSVLVVHPDPQCPGTASFRRISTTYTEWSNNKAVSTWINTADSFVACVDADPNAPEPPP